MNDERINTLANKLVNYSCELKKGENCLIEITGDTRFGEALIREVYAAGANPFLRLHSEKLERQLLWCANEQQLRLYAENDASLMSKMNAYIGVRSPDNSFELADVPDEKTELYNKLYADPVHSCIRVQHTKWVILRCPTTSMSQLAKMSTSAFEDFFYNVCNLDYGKMSHAMDALVCLMNKTDMVHIRGNGTDLSFSIKDIPAIKCAGKCNIPDGEVYTAPVRESVNGCITFNTPSLEQGFTFENIRLEFKNGKIVSACANNTQKLNKILDSDDGARYVGEFALGVNPYITSAMNDTLFDEKIAGSFHFTPGECYDDAPNGNKSCIHWDLVCIQTPEYGGGEIYFDDVLVRKDGRFVINELLALNPENLK